MIIDDDDDGDDDDGDGDDDDCDDDDDGNDDDVVVDVVIDAGVVHNGDTAVSVALVAHVGVGYDLVLCFDGWCCY